MERLYRSGSCRNEPRATSHTYVEEGDELYPMCGYGWNRSNGEAYSIFRGSYGIEGDCKRCQRNLAAGKEPVREGWPHPTKWI